MNSTVSTGPVIVDQFVDSKDEMTIEGLPPLPNGWGNFARLLADPRYRSTERPNARALYWTERVARTAAQLGLEPDRIATSVEGGAAVCFVRSRAYADIECFNSGDVVAVVSDGRNREVWEIDPNSGEIARALQRIREWLVLATNANASAQSASASHR